MTSTQFQFVKTEDGSLTARIGPQGTPIDENSETMHSFRGAFSETMYVYGQAIQKANDERAPEPVLSMGLGLGYVELLASAIAIKANRKVRGESFENVPELRNYFDLWLKSPNTHEPYTHPFTGIPTEFASTYNDILVRTAEATRTNATEVKQALRQAIENGEWLMREELTATTEFADKFGCICFDAFSSKTTPDLWTEEFLVSFLQKTAAPQCVLSTYACTGPLKRALKAEGFEVKIRPGFSSKRDSTFATRMSF